MAPERAALTPGIYRLLDLAERDPRRAVQLAHARYGDAPEHPLEQLAVGWAMLRWEQIAAARALLGAAEGQLAASDEPTLARHCRLGLLIAEQIAGAGARLQQAWEELCAAHLEAGEQAAAARARCEQIAHLNLLGRHGEARALAAAIEAIVARHSDPATQARYQHVAGVAAAGCGDGTTAERLLAGAAATFTALGRPVSVARVGFEQAWLLLRREQYGAACAALEAARAVFVRYELPLRVALCDRDLGYCLQRLGAFGESIACTVRARAAFLALGVPVPLATCDLNLGTVAHYSGLLDLADAAYGRAQAVYEAQGERRLALICRRNKAMLLLERDEPEAALALLDPIIAEARALGDAMEEAEGLAVRAKALAARDPDLATACLTLARQQFSAMGNRAAAAECLVDQGWLRLDRDDLEAARAALTAALEPLADRPAHLWRAHHGLGRVAEATGEPAAALAQYRLAVRQVADMRRALASEHASSAIYGRARRLIVDALALAARLDDTTSLLAFAEQQRALALRHLLASASPASDAALAPAQIRLRALLDTAAPPSELDGAIDDYVAALLEARHVAPPAALPVPALELAALRATLGTAYGDDWSMLAPIALERELLLVVLTPEELLLARTPADARLASLLDRACRPEFRQHTYRDLQALRNGTVPEWRVLHTLGTRLLPPALRARLHPEHRLLIVPDGPLHALPWAALRLEDGWLAEQAVVELLPALGLAQAVAPLATTAPALLLGCAEFGGRATPLPHALASLDQAAGLWPGPTERMAEGAATRGALLERAARGDLRRFGLIHIASHAQLNGVGLLAHIKLADEDLLCDEALRLNLDGALVVLAACDGAAGEVLPGDEVLGLSRALLAAGARSIVGGLWQLYDGGVLALLGPFYAALADGADPARALAHAQRALIAEGARGGRAAILSSPYVWGALCITSIGLTRRL